jgi:hypothetical protein
MRLALSWGIQASHEMPLLIHLVSFEIPDTETLSRLFCTTKRVRVLQHFHYLIRSINLHLLRFGINQPSPRAAIVEVFLHLDLQHLKGIGFGDQL